MNAKTLLILGTALAGCLPMAAQAQSTSSDDASTIIVTARRIEERLQDVPISITVYNQAQLAKNNVVTAQDLATNTPSMTANSNYGAQNSSYAIRGFIQENGTAPSVGVYFADVVSPRAASNGLPAGDGAGPGAFFDLQNVQVLKGPQGTLFGRNTTGGAVLLVPQKPTDKLEGYVQGSIGNYDLRRIQAVVNVPLADTFRVRLGVDRMKRRGYLNNTSGIGPKDFDDVDYTSFRLSIVGDLTPNLENYTIATYTNSDTNGDVHKLIAADPTYSLGSFAAAQLTPGTANYQGSNFYDVGQSLTNPRSHLKTWQVINTTTWKASDTITVKNIASYGQLYDYFQNPIFGTNFYTPAVAAVGLPSFSLPFASSQVYAGHETADESTFTEEFRIAGNSADNHLNWQAGAYLESVRPLDVVGAQSPVLTACSNAAAFQCYDVLGYLTFLGLAGEGFFRPYSGPLTIAPGVTLPSTIAGAINVTQGETSFHNVGLYGQATYKITEQFKVTGGFRYTWDKEDNTSTQITYASVYPNNPVTFQPEAPGIYAPATHCTYPDAAVQTIGAAGACTRTFHQRSSAPTWLIDFDYTPTHDMLFYAKYARGYRTGGIAPNVSPPYTVFQPEKVDSFEVGAKTSWGGSMPGTFDFAGFYNKFSNQQLQLGFNAAPNSPASPTAAPINAGKSRIYGVEIEASLRPFQGFSVQVGYAYLNSKITEVKSFVLDPSSPYVVGGGYFVGDPITLTPKNKVNVTGTYTLPLDNKLGKISLGATYVWTDKQFVNPSDRCYDLAVSSVCSANGGSSTTDAATAAYIRSLSYLPSYGILNLNVNWDNVFGQPFDLAFFATNVTKTKYYTYIPGLSTGVGFEDAVVGAPQMYGVSLKVRFGS